MFHEYGGEWSTVPLIHQFTVTCYCWHKVKLYWSVQAKPTASNQYQAEWFSRDIMSRKARHNLFTSRPSSWIIRWCWACETPIILTSESQSWLHRFDKNLPLRNASLHNFRNQSMSFHYSTLVATHTNITRKLFGLVYRDRDRLLRGRCDVCGWLCTIHLVKLFSTLKLDFGELARMCFTLNCEFASEPLRSTGAFYIKFKRWLSAAGLRNVRAFHESASQFSNESTTTGIS